MPVYVLQFDRLLNSFPSGVLTQFEILTRWSVETVPRPRLSHRLNIKLSHHHPRQTSR